MFVNNFMKRGLKEGNKMNFNPLKTQNPQIIVSVFIQMSASTWKRSRDLKLFGRHHKVVTVSIGNNANRN